MSRVLVIAVGSRGDVAPLTGVGVALQQDGHEVTVAAYTPFADMITSCGLGFRELPAQLRLAADGAEISPMKELAAFASPRGMRALGNDVLTAVADEPQTSSCCPRSPKWSGTPWLKPKEFPRLAFGFSRRQPQHSIRRRSWAPGRPDHSQIAPPLTRAHG